MSAIFDHPLVTERYFFPRADAPREVIRVEVDGATLACAAHRPHGDGAPLLVHFHGNGETVADYLPDFADAVAARGFNSFFVEYRGYGASTGTPALARMLGDVGVVLRSLAEPPERIFVYGRSIGSIYAIEAARCEPRLAGVILESGIADPLERVLLRVSAAELGVDGERLHAAARSCFDHERKLSDFPGRVLVLHARFDHLVDFSHAERLARWSAHAELVLFPRGDHNTILAINHAAIMQRLRSLAFGAGNPRERSTP